MSAFLVPGRVGSARCWELHRPRLWEQGQRERPLEAGGSTLAFYRVGSSGWTLLKSPHELTVRLAISVNGTKVSAAMASL